MKKVAAVFSLIILSLQMAGQSTFNDVAPLLYKNCTSCHRPGGGAPFSMLSYASTAPWTTSIVHVLQNSEMPPWSVDTSYIHFVNERQITQADKDSLLKWIYDGSAQGDPNLQPPTPAYPLRQLAGTPDTVLQMMKFKSNATTSDAYNTLVVPLNLGQNRFLRAIELVPNDPQLVHHALIMAGDVGDIDVDTTGSSFSTDGEISIGTWAPGSMPIVYPNSSLIKMGIELPANGEIGMQIHTPKGTAGQLIDIKLRMYLYPVNESGVRQVHDTVPLQYWANDFFIPAGQVKSFSVEEVWPPQNVSIFSAFPHSHQICSEILNYAYKPQTNDTIPLMKIDRWDFEHQEYYYYKNLVKVPAGYTVHSTHSFDNRSTNHHNPNSPPQLITVGFSTDDEMLFDGFQYLSYQAGDEYINIDSILKNDPLLLLDISEHEKSVASRSVVVPNPIQSHARIEVVPPLSASVDYQLNVYNKRGQAVNIEYSIEDGVIHIHRSYVSSGTYFYEVVSGTQRITAGRLIFN